MRTLIVLLIFLGNFANAQPSEMSVEGEFGALFGTYHRAGDAQVLILPGSGPIDRNGLRENALGAGVYAKLAAELASRGISSLRIDKRGSFASGQAIRSTEDLRIKGYAIDARAWVDHLLKTQASECVWLLGHSEGGLVASVVVQTDPKGICGVILAASAGRSIDLVLHDQLKLHTRSKRILRKIDNALASLKAGERIDHKKLPVALRGLFNPVNQGFYIDWMTYEPTEVIADYTGPVQILQGTTDFQIKPKDAQALAEVLPQAELEIFEGMNHNFSETDLIFPPSDIELMKTVMDKIAAFIAVHQR